MKVLLMIFTKIIIPVNVGTESARELGKFYSVKIYEGLTIMTANYQK